MCCPSGDGVGAAEFGFGVVGLVPNIVIGVPVGRACLGVDSGDEHVALEVAGEYNCDLQKGNNSGFGLMLVRRAPQVTTDIEGANQSQNGVRKLLINGQLFIEKEGKLFNVTGQRL